MMQTKTSKRIPTAGCLFSGMGGLATGLQISGFTISWATDNDEHAGATFCHRFPKVRFIPKDIKKLSAQTDQLGGVDLLAGGFPCQSFSQAGDRKGFADPRGKLFFEIPRLLREMDLSQRPRLLVFENVPHLVHGDGGEWFDAIQRSLRQAGYWFRSSACFIANLKDYTELPQDRERLFMVAASKAHFPCNPFSPAAIQRYSGGRPRPISEFIDRAQRSADEAYLPEENRYYKMIRREMELGESSENVYQLRRSYVREKKHALCPTLTANMGIGGHNVPFVQDKWGIRKMSVNEVASLQGFAATELLFPPTLPESERYRLIGNAACVHLTALVGSVCFRIMEEYP